MKKIAIPLTHVVFLDQRIVIKNRLVSIPEGIAAAIIFCIGFTPITALAFALMGICSLSLGTLILVVPAITLALTLGCYHGQHGTLMWRGYLMGIIAVACYDCVRIPFTMMGWMDDFIPKIGGMLLGDGDPHVVIGYLWRYLGNGGGMGMAFVCGYALLRHRFLLLRLLGGLNAALLFGCFVWACLMVTLLLSPHGEEVMFAITPMSLSLSLIGHLVFGCALGCLVRKDEAKQLFSTPDECKRKRMILLMKKFRML